MPCENGIKRGDHRCIVDVMVENLTLARRKFVEHCLDAGMGAAFFEVHPMISSLPDQLNNILSPNESGPTAAIQDRALSAEPVRERLLANL